MPALAQGVDEDGLLEEFLDMIDIGCWDNDASIADEHDVMNDDDVIMSDDEHDNHDLDSTKRVGKECDNTCANIHSSLPSVNNPPSEAPSAWTVHMLIRLPLPAPPSYDKSSYNMTNAQFSKK